MNKIKQIPIPFCGLALALAVTGNLIQSDFPVLRVCFGWIAFAILLLFLIKVLLFFPLFCSEMSNSVQASVSGTFCMAWMLLSVYIKPFAETLGRIIWFVAVFLHIALIVYFSIRFMRKLKVAEYHASFYIVYVGIAVASITAPAWNMQLFGKGIAIFGVVSLLLLVIPITGRYLKMKDIPAAAQPLFAISAAPASLCIVGLKNSFGTPWAAGLFLLFCIGTLLYVPAFILAMKKIAFRFYPGFAAFTFPFVISAIASGIVKSMLETMPVSYNHPVLCAILNGWFVFQKIAAVFITLFVLGRFVYHLFIQRCSASKSR